jgi:hypothetical protein
MVPCASVEARARSEKPRLFNTESVMSVIKWGVIKVNHKSAKLFRGARTESSPPLPRF